MLDYSPVCSATCTACRPARGPSLVCRKEGWSSPPEVMARVTNTFKNKNENFCKYFSNFCWIECCFFTHMLVLDSFVFCLFVSVVFGLLVSDACLGGCVSVDVQCDVQVCGVLSSVCRKEGLSLPAELAARVAKSSKCNLRRAVLMLEACRVQQ